MDFHGLDQTLCNLYYMDLYIILIVRLED